MGPNEFSKFSDMDPNNNPEGSNQDESHSKAKECILKVSTEASKQSRVIWIKNQPKELQSLALKDGLEFHILSTSKSQKLIQSVK